MLQYAAGFTLGTAFCLLMLYTFEMIIGVLICVLTFSVLLLR